MRQLYELALDCGIKPTEFCDYSIAEVYDVIDSYLRREKTQVRQQVSQQFIQAEVIASWVANVISGGDGKVPKPWDYYPALFENEQETANTIQRQSEVTKASENRRKYAEEFNRRRRG